MAAFEPMAHPRWNTRRFVRFVRKVHLYSGLLLLPWLMFFGASGILFNHPNLGEEVRAHPVTPEALAAHGVFAWDAHAVATRVVERLNAERAAGAPFALDPARPSDLEGVALLNADEQDGRTSLLLDMTKGRGVLVTRTARQRAGDGTTFAPRSLDIGELSTHALAEKLAALPQAQGLGTAGPLRAHERIAPGLRMRVLDAHGVAWNLRYETGAGVLHGRRADAPPKLGVAQIFAKLHMTHHFPTRLGARFAWALFADLLGLAMLLWAISGVIMWWQLAGTRRAGLVGLAVAFGVAGAVFAGTLAELTFADVPEVLGPGD